MKATSTSPSIYLQAAPAAWPTSAVRWPIAPNFRLQPDAEDPALASITVRRSPRMVGCPASHASSRTLAATTSA